MKIAAVVLSVICICMKTSAQELPAIDVDKYRGDWYVIGFKPSFLDKKWMNIMESYLWNFEKQRFEVEASYTKRPDGKIRHVSQKLFPVENTNNARWTARIWFFIRADYWIYKIAPDYSYVVVGHPKQKYVYIMARRPEMEEQLYNDLVDFCVSIGYERKDIQRCHHDKRDN